MVGRLAATTSTTLTDTPTGTRIAYRIESVLTGKLGSLGQPVLKAKARDMERQFVDRLRTAFPPSTPTPA